jgi:hypothetical protein
MNQKWMRAPDLDRPVAKNSILTVLFAAHVESVEPVVHTVVLLSMKNGISA